MSRECPVTVATKLDLPGGGEGRDGEGGRVCCHMSCSRRVTKGPIQPFFYGDSFASSLEESFEPICTFTNFKDELV
jgi:hypothetical protein